MPGKLVTVVVRVLLMVEYSGQAGVDPGASCVSLKQKAAGSSLTGIPACGTRRAREEMRGNGDGFPIHLLGDAGQEVLDNRY